tara:strand:+ start:398 stop:574 length:177 start_codon:yes stop_codon:yes gene_type:complete
MNITKAKYQSNPLGENENSHIEITVNNEIWVVPINNKNRHYIAIQEWVAEGNTIKDAD